MEKKVGIIVLSAILCTLFLIPLSMGREKSHSILLEHTSTKEIEGLSYPFIAKMPPMIQYSNCPPDPPSDIDFLSYYRETWDWYEPYRSWLNSSSLTVYDPSQLDIIIYVASLNESNIRIAYLNANNSWVIVPYAIISVGWPNRTYPIV